MTLPAWFRFYGEALNDPKILRLSAHEFRAWVNLLCIASHCNGSIDLHDIELRMRLQKQIAHRMVHSLIDKGLMDRIDSDTIEPHNWHGRQYHSDVSTDRVKRFRNAQRNVSETPPDTDTDQIQKQNRTEQNFSERAGAREEKKIGNPGRTNRSEPKSHEGARSLADRVRELEDSQPLELLRRRVNANEQTSVGTLGDRVPGSL